MDILLTDHDLVVKMECLTLTLDALKTISGIM